MNLILTLDIGTSEIKIALFNENLNLQRINNTKTKVVYSKNGNSEMDMNHLWKTCVILINKTLDKKLLSNNKIIGIGITANMVGLWPITKNGKPVRNAILWNDLRTLKILDKMFIKDKKIYEKIFNESGSVLQYGCTIPLIKWYYENEFKNFNKTKWFLNCKDWIRYKLTDEVANDYTETVVAPGNAKKISRSGKIFKLFNLNDAAIKKLPIIKKSDSIAGYITKRTEKLTKIPFGTPVVIGAGDVPSTILGVGASKPGSAATIFGTTIHNCFVSRKPVFHPKNIGLLFYSPNSTWLKTMINVAGTINLDWAIKNFFDYEEYLLDKKKYLHKLELKIKNIPIGSNNLIYLPYINFGGIIAPFHNEKATGVFYGLNHKHNKYEILRSIYEGVSLSIMDCYNSIDKKIYKLYLAGGGSKSKLWCQMISDTLNIEVIIPKGEEFGAKGAALLTLKSLNKIDLKNDKNNKIKIKKKFLPNKINNVKFKNIYKNYKYLSRRLFSNV